MSFFDVVIIGGGPGGMSTGMMFHQMGKSVALIQEEQDSIGGVCLNRGCMPTKALLKAAKVYLNAKQAERYGLEVSAGPVDLKRLRTVVDQDLNRLRTMTQTMMGDKSLSVIRGRATFRSAHEVEVAKNDGSAETVNGELIVIATGSEPVELPFAPFDGQYILSSDQILQNTDLPETLLIIGGGAIGCEFATMYNSFGSKIILAEAQDTLLPREDPEVGVTLKKAFTAQGMQVKTGVAIKKLSIENGRVTVTYQGLDTTDRVDKVLVGIGRKPNISGLNLEAAGVDTTGGAIKIDEFMQTSVPHIYALGDVIGGLMLAHAAGKEGAHLVMNLMQGPKKPLNLTGVPRVAFCHPEVAAVGVSQERDGIKSFCLPQVPNGRTVVDKVSPAFVKLFVEAENSVIAGASIIGEAATEMIHELAVAVENQLTVEQISQTVHVHPSHSTNIVTTMRQYK